MAITYRELNDKADRLALALRKKGVGPGGVVALVMARSIDMVIGMLAILKAGAAYLPIDPAYPQERKRYMLADSGAEIVLKDNVEIESTLTPLLRGVARRAGVCNTLSTGVPQRQSGRDLLVYVIYTSGSTGRPKGVMLEHRSLVNLLKFQHRYTELECRRVSQFASIGFDISFQEIFSTLLYGGSLFILAERFKTDIPGLCRLILREQIETLYLPISFIRAIFNDNDYADQFPGSVRHIQAAGEQVVVIERFRRYLVENNVCLHNHYGPSETHVVTTLTLEPGDNIPELPSIGRPIGKIGRASCRERV